jgi:hypothetical protein
MGVHTCTGHCGAFRAIPYFLFISYSPYSANLLFFRSTRDVDGIEDVELTEVEVHDGVNDALAEHSAAEDRR